MRLAASRRRAEALGPWPLVQSGGSGPVALGSGSSRAPELRLGRCGRGPAAPLHVGASAPRQEGAAGQQAVLRCRGRARTCLTLPQCRWPSAVLSGGFRPRLGARCSAKDPRGRPVPLLPLPWSALSLPPSARRGPSESCRLALTHWAPSPVRAPPAPRGLETAPQRLAAASRANFVSLSSARHSSPGGQDLENRYFMHLTQFFICFTQEGESNSYWPVLAESRIPLFISF